jgi:hypothetical protein
LGYLYQTHRCSDMEGIMELVIYLEDRLQLKDKMTEEERNQPEEDKDDPMLLKTIAGLTQKIEKLTELNQFHKEQMENTMVIKDTMRTLRDNMRTWTEEHYPDMEDFRGKMEVNT